jgi:RHS repeat-associated protein
VVHEYTYDSAGRLSDDRVDLTGVHTGQNVDGSILAIVTAYDDVGRVLTVTSYNNATARLSGNVVNQVEYQYDGWGNLAAEYQAHDGAVDTGSTPDVEYAYDDGAAGGVAKYNRLADVVYPNGRTVGYDYASGVDNLMSRLSSIFDDADGNGVPNNGETVYSSYKYLGAGTIVEEDYPEVQVKQTYLDSNGNVAGFDRFGRVVDQIWTDYSGTPTPIDEYTYTYDRAGNRISKTNVLNGDLSETYEYNDLDELISTVRNNGFDQSWDLDSLGNWSEFDDDGSTQTRDVNEANEIIDTTGIDTPEYDAAGNMISDGTLKYKYDAWNRLTYVTLADDSPVASYFYDGLGRRVKKTFPDDTGVEYFYNQNWQMLEERNVDDEGDATAVNQYVWSQRYIDAPIMRFHDGNADADCLDVGDNVRYYTGDANHNVTATIDASSGDVVNRYSYTAYGQATEYDDDWSNAAAPTADGPLYCGYFFDSETGNYCVRHRYLSTALGTFISRDPIGYKGGINLYEYVGDNPIDKGDPTGLSTLVQVPPDKPSIACKGGELVVQNPNNTASRPCMQAHELQHLKDWKARYGDDLCKGVPDGYLPVGSVNGDDYNEFRRKSECRAYKMGIAICQLLKVCKKIFPNGDEQSQINDINKIDLYINSATDLYNNKYKCTGNE